MLAVRLLTPQIYFTSTQIPASTSTTHRANLKLRSYPLNHATSCFALPPLHVGGHWPCRTYDMSTFESAIDDSFEPTPLQEPVNDDVADAFDNAYNGPREGHWEVSSSVGSFIDDRCPTVYDYPTRPAAGGESAAIQGGLAKKLIQAAIEDKRAAAAKDAAVSTSVRDKPQPLSSPPNGTKSKPFVIPPFKPRAARPNVENNETAKPTKPHPPQNVRSQSKPKEYSVATRPANSTHVVDVQKASEPASQPKSGSRMIRILGRNGEEAFVELSPAPSFTNAGSTRNSTFEKQAAENAPQPTRTKSIANEVLIKPTPEASKQTKPSKREKKKQQNNQANAQMPIRQANNTQADEPAMSGALPVSSHHSALEMQSAAGSCKDSAVVISGKPDAASRPGSDISQRALSAAKAIATMSATSSKQFDTAEKIPLSRSFQEVGAGQTTGFPVPGSTGGQSNRAAAFQHQTSQPNPQTSIRNRKSEKSLGGDDGMQDTARSDYKPPTVQSAGSSSSIAHSFGGFTRNDKASRSQAQSVRESKASSRQAKSDHSKSVSYVASASNKVPSASKTASSRGSRSFAKNASPANSISKPERHGSRSRSINQSPEGGWDYTRPSSSHQQQTNFAGDGWISPHPLSVASSDLRSPQSVVQLSTPGPGQNQTLTYEEWNAQREHARSISGSFAGSHVPTALGSQAIPSVAYNHPPPVGYVGSYREVTPRDQQQYPPANSIAGTGWNQSPWATQGMASYHSMPPQALQSFFHSVSAASAHSGSVYQTPSVLVQHADWNLPPQYDGSGSGAHESYNVGLTPKELDSYQSQLGSTISRYSSHLSHVEQEQAPPQPDYSAWNSGQSHRSVRSSYSQTGPASSPPNLPQHGKKIQLLMPWDQPTANASQLPSQSDHLGLLNIRGPCGREDLDTRGPAPPRLSRHESNVSASGTLRPTYSSARSEATHSAVRAPPSEVSYGTVEWQNLENAEQGRGRFRGNGMC